MNGKSILIVDDEAPIREMIVVALEMAGYDCLEAENTQQAHALIIDRKPDLILLDWMLPGTSGIELARRLKRDELTADTPIIMLTAKGEEDNKIQGLEVGADDYITKPFSPRELVARLKAVLRRATPVDSEAPIEIGGLLLDPELSGKPSLQIGFGAGLVFAAQVVIQHDDVGACRCGQGVMAQRAAVHADDQVVICCKGRHGGGVGAIALVDAVGDIESRVPPLAAQPVQQQGGRAAAVHVVVGEDGNAFAVDGRCHQPVRRDPHVAQGQRIGQQVAQAGRQEALGPVRLDPPVGQDARDGQGQARTLRQPFGQAVGGAVRADPPPIRQRLLDSQKRHACTFFFVQIPWGKSRRDGGRSPLT